MYIISTGVIDTGSTYHGWPTVAITPEGRLLAAASGNRERHICPMGRSRLYISDDNGNTWSSAQHLSDGPLDDRDTGLCVCADGSIVLTYLTSAYALMSPKPDDPPHWDEVRKSISIDTVNREHNFWMRRSTDGGNSWGDRYSVPVSNPHGPSLNDDGTLFIAGVKKSPSPAYQTGGYLTSGEPVAAVSRDNGRNWEIISAIPVPAGQSGNKFHELHSVQASDGRIVVQIRNHNVPPVSTWQTESFDGGVSWSEPRYICRGFPSHLLRLSDGKLLMSYSWRYDNYGIRLRVSSDNGDSWGEEIILYDGGSCHDLGYPSTVQLADGTLFTLWYENVTWEEKDFSIHKSSRATLKYCRWSL